MIKSETENLTESQRKINFLNQKIELSIEIFSKKRNENKLKAWRFKMIATALSGIITVLAGVSISGNFIVISNIVILLLGALTTFLITWDTFYNHKDLWIKYTLIYSKLLNLKIKAEYLMLVEPNELSLSEVDALLEEYTFLLSENTEQWLQMRKTKKEENSKTSN